MPRTPINYQNTIIYVIKCRDDTITEEYIGSTTNFIERKCKHKSTCNNEKDKSYNELKYKFIRLNGGWDNWIMIELEKFSCSDKNEAHKREEEIRVERKAKLNMIKAFGAETKKGYQTLYRKEHKIQMKQWYEKNKEQYKNYYEAKQR
jgi:predicted GIY-YIG superfamily endonuclease